MSDNFLDLIYQLKNSDRKEKDFLLKRNTLLKKISEVLENGNARNISGFVYRTLESISRKNPQLKLKDILESEFCETRITEYKDDDSLYKIALGITFLRDYLLEDNLSDQDLLSTIVNSFIEMNIDEVFNDVSVNIIQSRNGEFS